jgi:hypothetical protein
MFCRNLIVTSLVAGCLCAPAFAADKKTRVVFGQVNSAFSQAVERIVQREAENQKALEKYNPIAETYIQLFQPDKELGFKPVSDDYFIGRASFDKGARTNTMLSRSAWWKKIVGEPNGEFNSEGFAQMVQIDSKNFDRQHYDFEYIGREFVGELRCIVVDVKPRPHTGDGRFIGRVWVEDQGYNIVRFNGTYVGHHDHRAYTHFDTWRLNLQPGVWLPAYVYSQETGMKSGFGEKVTYRAQTRLWAYDVGRAARENEFTEVQVDTADAVSDQSDKVQDLSPVSSERAWQRQAENNVLDRLERAGLLAKPGDVDKVLGTVINNLIVTNNLNIDPEVRARVLLTSPIESLTVGHTIIISRGLIDSLPDEASLAAVLAHELAHIQLDHGMNTDFAYSDKTFFADEATLRRLHFARDAGQEDEADKKAVEILQKSPYQSKLANAGLFLRQLQTEKATLPHLIQSHLGDSMMLKKDVRLSELRNQAPNLEPGKVDQISALPLGGRVKVDPWSDKIEMTHNKAVALNSAKEKMPLEVTPFFPYLTRLGDAEARAARNKQDSAPATDQKPATPPANATKPNPTEPQKSAGPGGNN